MLNNINQFTKNISLHFNPWTNVYGFARSLMALSLLLTLVFNDTMSLFRPTSDTDSLTNSDNVSLFHLVPQEYFYLSLVKWLFVVLLILIIIGWRPRITGLIHFYIAYSFNTAGTTVDGGEQVHAVFALLLLPIALTDNRKWHWEKNNDFENREIARIVTFVSYFFIRLQVAIIYFHSTVAKISNTEWIDGTAVYYYMADPMLGLPKVIYNLISPILGSPLIVFITWGTLVLQLILVTALFMKKEYWSKCLVIALLFHEAIAIMLGLISFSMIMTAVLILYLKPLESEFSFINKILNKIKLRGGEIHEKTA